MQKYELTEKDEFQKGDIYINKRMITIRTSGSGCAIKVDEKGRISIVNDFTVSPKMFCENYFRKTK